MIVITWSVITLVTRFWRIRNFFTVKLHVDFFFHKSLPSAVLKRAKEQNVVGGVSLSQAAAFREAKTTIELFSYDLENSFVNYSLFVLSANG